MSDIPELKVGNLCHAKKVSIIFDDGVEATYNAPRGRMFAMILIGDEDPGDLSLSADEFLKAAGWEFTG